jgi:hypothetical protein
MNNRDYTAQSTVLSADFITMLDHHPESFDCLFFKAELSAPEDVTPSSVTDVVGSIEGTERKISYADPVESRARVVPDEGLSMLAFEAGQGEDAHSGAEPLVVLLKESNVPKQSIITWTDVTGTTTTKTMTYYVLESKPFGRAPVAGMKHYCIPMPSEGEQEA